MARVPHAARVLTRQVTDLKPQAKITPHGDPDGLDVIRALRFNKAVGNWLLPLLEEIDDPRIADLEKTTQGLIVHFVPTVKADNAQPFPLEAAQTVAGE